MAVEARMAGVEEQGGLQGRTRGVEESRTEQGVIRKG
jgi:hypothetical protein